MENNEIKILYETIVKYDKEKFDTKLTITEKKINLEKKKGLFKKVYKVVDSIDFEDIKIRNDNVQVTKKHTDVEIETSNKTYKFGCNNIIEAQKLTEHIIRIKTGANLLERTSDKVVKFGKVVAKTATTIGGAIASIGGVAIAINKNKKEILKAFNALKNMIKK